MILMSTYLLGEIPFKTVYLHGLVRDGQGRKMSKSLGNIIDPVDMVDKYGADAVRLALIIGTAPGNDSKLSENKIRVIRCILLVRRERRAAGNIDVAADSTAFLRVYISIRVNTAVIYSHMSVQFKSSGSAL